MQTRLLGTSEIQITPIIMGTWQAGKKMWVGIEDADTIKAIRAAFDAGITTVDTAEVYGEGHSEQIVASALSDVRDKAVYATKVFANHLKYDQVIEACDRSLKNLNTDYIDLYQIHWPAGTFKSEIVPIEETMNALNHLKEQGKIRAIGVSNFNRAQLEEAAQYGRIDSLQPPYSLFWRWIEKDLTPYCVENNISIVAYSSLAQGLLTGKFEPGHKFDPQDNRAKNKLFQGENYDRAQSALDKLRPIAERHQCSLAQLALAWLIAQPQANAIAGARNEQQAVDNAKAGDINLSADDVQEIDAIGRIVTDHLDDNPIMWNW
ncbi:aldo/keto reductase [Funiculus sociatus GB2-A5]|uniref:Aldo/keto reductase n=1 Tax=Funiculus sociatus GB2-A5 TaxID=2933946 RepID=A0ABV0JSV9_9CYAN|nr:MULTISPECIES: aldo/keto reductase [unclassified Trichocoleus]MBD1906728.1 aldo/keto reductase [Trichocoleus sp. FACHB-832]MBD2063165.1 aldo/keto reductase [Trichocoleus sp. FACHB-6]